MTKNTIGTGALALLLFFGGIVIGLFIRADSLELLLNPLAANDVEEDPQVDDHEDEEHIHLTEPAYKNLGLKCEPVTRSDYVRWLRMPARVVEKAGHSNHSLTAPVTGVVSRLYVDRGQTVVPGDPLFELQVTDETLAEAQLKLLEVLSRLEVVETELQRLAPLKKTGAVAGRVHLEVKYERQELDSNRQVRIQELLVRGLNQQQVGSILQSKKLIRKLTVRLPQRTDHSEEQTSEVQDDRLLDLNYTIEDLRVAPGMAVSRGDELCHLAHHQMLYIKGQAFENEIDKVTKATKRGSHLIAEFGLEGHEIARGDLSVHYIENHVDDENQTYAFYVPLRNEVVKETVDDSGKRFRTWRFKPGQRAYLRIPLETWRDKIKLPISATVREGPDVFVFREHVEPPPSTDEATVSPEPDAHEEDVFIELERVPVHVLYEDSEYAIIADDGPLKIGERVAMNAAYQLHLALKVQAGGGHGHDHHH